MTSRTGTIFNIQRFSVHDGPGVRTTVFMKGCPLACDWCHNPESQDVAPTVVRLRHHCIECGLCTPGELANPVVANRDAGDVERCPSGALQMIGERIDARALVARLLRDRVFFDESHGGVTLSGGEPLVQAPFVIDLLKGLHAEGVHTALDTCGFTPWEHLRAAAAVADLILYDLKLMDPARHAAATGVSNERILDNLRQLAKLHRNVWIRVPVIPGINDDAENMDATAGFLATLQPAPRVSLLPYHPAGAAKFARLGKSYTLRHLATPSQDALETIAARFAARGLAASIGGQAA